MLTSHAFASPAVAGALGMRYTTADRESAMAGEQPKNKDDRLDGQRSNAETPNSRNRENKPPGNEVDRQRGQTGDAARKAGR